MFKGLCLITIVWFVGMPMHVLAAACTPETAAEKHILWGDLHIHTGYSMDAYAFGARLDPAAAYRFARGAPQTLPGGVQYALDRPLDFAAVTDHAETFGVINLCTVRDSDHPYCRGFVEASDGKSRRAFDEFFLPALYDDSAPEVCTDGADCRGAQVDLWARTIQAAEDANEPCPYFGSSS